MSEWMVIWKVDTEPVSVYPFEEKDDALALFDSIKQNYTDACLVRVIKGPWPGSTACPNLAAESIQSHAKLRHLVATMSDALQRIRRFKRRSLFDHHDMTIKYYNRTQDIAQETLKECGLEEQERNES